MKKLLCAASVLPLTLSACVIDNSYNGSPEPAASPAGQVSAVPADGELPYPLTPAGAKQFVEAAEADLFELLDIAGRAAWINSTYINDDSDRLNAYFGTIMTEKGVDYATTAAKYAEVDGLDYDTVRKLKKK